MLILSFTEMQFKFSALFLNYRGSQLYISTFTWKG